MAEGLAGTYALSRQRSRLHVHIHLPPTIDGYVTRIIEPM